MIIDLDYMTKQELIEYILNTDPKDINWYMISKKDLPEDIIVRYKDKLHLYHIVRWKKLSEETIIAILDRFTDIDWINLSFMQTLSEQFIQKYKDQLYIDAVCEYQKLSVYFIMNNLEDIYFKSIMKNKYISDEIKTYIRMFI